VSALPLALNVGAFVGHTPVRYYVLGEEAADREATDAEIAEMARIVEEAMRAGAMGFATSSSAGTWAPTASPCRAGWPVSTSSTSWPQRWAAPARAS